MRKDRDTIVAEGRAAHAYSMSCGKWQKGPWIYKAKVKSGTRSTVNVENTFTSIPHLNGEMILRHARQNETISVYGINRVMKSQMRSYREDI